VLHMVASESLGRGTARSQERREASDHEPAPARRSSTVHPHAEGFGIREWRVVCAPGEKKAP